MAETSREIMEQLKSIKNDAGNFKEVSDKLSGRVEEASVVLQDIIIKIKKINDATKTIQAIANKTNMLALNATIESARAGEAGRGFSVVSQQMQQLANTSKESSQQVFETLNELSKGMGKIDEELKNLFEEINKQNELSVNMLSNIENMEQASNELMVGAEI